MKKLSALLLAILMVCSLAACGGGNDTPDPSGSNTPGSSQQQPSDNDTGLTAEQQAFIDSLGKSTEGLTIVAYKESEKYVSYFIYSKPEGGVMEHKLYRLYKSEEWYKKIAYKDDGECIFDEDRHSDDLRWILVNKSDYPFTINGASSYEYNRDNVVEAGYTLVK